MRYTEREDVYFECNKIVNIIRFPLNDRYFLIHDQVYCIEKLYMSESFIKNALMPPDRVFVAKYVLQSLLLTYDKLIRDIVYINFDLEWKLNPDEDDIDGCLTQALEQGKEF